MKNIIEKYKNNVKSIIKNLTGNQNDDLEQEVYVKTWKNLDKYKDNGKFQRWISTITSNICKDYLKSSYAKNLKNTAPESESDNLSSNKYDIENIFETKTRRHKVSKAILQLSPKLQEVIVMYEIDGLDYEQISAKLKCPIGTVKSRLYKARQELSILLKDIL